MSTGRRPTPRGGCRRARPRPAAEALVAGGAVAQHPLLRVEALRHVGGAVAERPEARRECAVTTLADRCDRAPPACSNARNTSSSTATPGAAGVELGVDRRHRPEQLHGLVGEVRAEVEQQPAAVGRVAVLAPRLLLGLPRQRSKRREFEPQHAAVRARERDAPQRRKSFAGAGGTGNGPAAVRRPAPGRRARGRRRHRDRLVDHDVTARVERRLRQRHVEALARRRRGVERRRRPVQRLDRPRCGPRPRAWPGSGSRVSGGDLHGRGWSR